MSMAGKKALVASMAVSLLAVGHTSHAQGAPQGGDANASAYVTQHFSFDALNADVKDAITHANLAPVPFLKISLHTRETVSAVQQAPQAGQSSQPPTYTSAITFENAGHGLVRREEAVQDNKGSVIATRLDLAYHGYFPLLTQGIPANANSLPPVQETRKVLRFDTGTSGHIAFVYLYGMTGGPTFADPGQFLCDSGKTYSASQLNPSIQGQAVELTCRVIDNNGMETDKVTFAYLEHYNVAVTVRTHNDQRTVDSAILDFNVQ